MQVERLESFKDLSEDDTSLLESVGQRHFYCGAYWFRNFENHGLESEATLRIYTVKAEPEGQSMALLALRRPAGQGGSVLHGRAPGSRSLASLTSFQSTLFDISMREDCPSAGDAAEAIARSIREERPAWGLVDIDLMDSASRNYPLLIAAFSAAGWVVRPYKHIVTVYEAYLSAYKIIVLTRVRISSTVVGSHDRFRRPEAGFRSAYVDDSITS